MAINGTVQTTAEFAPTSTGDTYAILDARYLRDGFRNVDLLTDLDEITQDRRKAGMIVGVSGGTNYYKLLPEGTGWTFTISDWSEVDFNGGGGSGAYLPLSGGTMNESANIYFGELSGNTQTYFYGSSVSSSHSELYINQSFDNSGGGYYYNNLDLYSDDSQSYILFSAFQSPDGITNSLIDFRLDPINGTRYTDSSGNPFMIKYAGTLNSGNTFNVLDSADTTTLAVLNDGRIQFKTVDLFPTSGNELRLLESNTLNGGNLRLLNLNFFDSGNPTGLTTPSIFAPSGANLALSAAGLVRFLTPIIDLSQQNTIVDTGSVLFKMGSTNKEFRINLNDNGGGTPTFEFSASTGGIGGTEVNTLLLIHDAGSTSSGITETALKILTKNNNSTIGTIIGLEIDVTNGTGLTKDYYTLKLIDGNEGLGKVLVSDANGQATWGNVTFTGNTSADCISDLYVDTINACSLLTIEGSTLVRRYGTSMELNLDSDVDAALKINQNNNTKFTLRATNVNDIRESHTVQKINFIVSERFLNTGGTKEVLFLNGSNGFVGLGTNNPNGLFDLKWTTGVAMISGPNANNGSGYNYILEAEDNNGLLLGYNTVASTDSRYQMDVFSNGARMYMYGSNLTTNTHIKFDTRGSGNHCYFFLTGSTNFGIGTTSPNAKLNVFSETGSFSDTIFRLSSNALGSILEARANGCVGLGAIDSNYVLNVDTLGLSNVIRIGSNTRNVIDFNDTLGGFIRLYNVSGITQTLISGALSGSGYENSYFINPVGFGNANPSSTVDISGVTGYNQFRMRTSYTPTSSGDTNGNIGNFTWDNNYLYLKTNTGWGRVNLDYAF